MQTLTLNELRVTKHAGGVAGVTLKALDAAFFVHIETKNGDVVMLAKARSNEARSFSNPLQALNVLHKLGLDVGAFDVEHWNPEDKNPVRTRPDRAQALKEAHRAAEHDKWFRAQVKEALREADDPSTQWISHEEVKASWAKKRAELVKLIEGEKV